MDHYLIYFNDGESCNMQIIKNTFLQSEELKHCSEYFVPFMFSLPKNYLTFINPHSRSHEDLEFKEVDADNLSQTIAGLLNSNCDAFQQSSKDNGCILSEQVNNLADQLPLSGTYILDVIINDDVLAHQPIKENLELGNSLYRLVKWHKAHITVVSSGKLDKIDGKEWMDLLRPEIVSNAEMKHSGAVLWRGSAQFQYCDKSSSLADYELKLNCSPIRLGKENYLSEQTSRHLVLSPNLTAIDICSFNSIPRYMFVPLSFQLCKMKFQISSNDMLDTYLKDNVGATIIMRLYYTICDRKPRSNKYFSTRKWKKMISSGFVKFPECDLPHFDMYTTFAISRCTESALNVVAFPLLEPSFLNTSYHFSMVNWINKSRHRSKISQADESSISEEVQVPILSNDDFISFTKESKLNKENQICNYQKIVSSHINDHCRYFLIKTPINVTYDEIDTCDWSEWISLFQKQSDLEEQKNMQTKLMMNLSPCQPTQNVDFSCEDVLKCFLSSGEAKDISKAETVELIKSVQIRKTDFSTLLNADWPSPLNYTHNDVYYNFDNNAEEKELLGNSMANLYVKFETLSTCSEQPFGSAYNLKSFHMTPTKVWRNLSIKKVDSSILKDLVNDSPRHNSLESKNTMRSHCKDRHKNNEHSRKNHHPVRCSPRSKKLVNYACLANTRRSLNFSKSKNESQDLAEVLKKKLRVAVATALENHGIHLNDEYFRPCGKKLFAICQTFLQDIPKTGKTSQHMQKIADSHVKQVIEFEHQKRS